MCQGRDNKGDIKHPLRERVREDVRESPCERGRHPRRAVHQPRSWARVRCSSWEVRPGSRRIALLRQRRLDQGPHGVGDHEALWIQCQRPADPGRQRLRRRGPESRSTERSSARGSTETGMCRISSRQRRSAAVIWLAHGRQEASCGRTRWANTNLGRSAGASGALRGSRGEARGASAARHGWSCSVIQNDRSAGTRRPHSGVEVAVGPTGPALGSDGDGTANMTSHLDGFRLRPLSSSWERVPPMVPSSRKKGALEAIDRRRRCLPQENDIRRRIGRGDEYFVLRSAKFANSTTGSTRYRDECDGRPRKALEELMLQVRVVELTLSMGHGRATWPTLLNPLFRNQNFYSSQCEKHPCSSQVAQFLSTLTSNPNLRIPPLIHQPPITNFQSLSNRTPTSNPSPLNSKLPNISLPNTTSIPAPPTADLQSPKSDSSSTNLETCTSAPRAHFHSLVSTPAMGV